MSTQFPQSIIFAECKVCIKDLHKPKFGGKMDDGVRKFVVNAQQPHLAICTRCGYVSKVSDLIAQEIREISLEDLE